MQVQISKQVTITVEVESGYYKGKLLDKCFYYVRPSGQLVYVASKMIYLCSPDVSNYQKSIEEIIEDYLPCEQSEFEVAKDRVLCELAHFVTFPELVSKVNPASGSAGDNYMLDPKEQAAAGQEQAVESAAQDTAMEVTESAEATEG